MRSKCTLRYIHNVRIAYVKGHQTEERRRRNRTLSPEHLLYFLYVHMNTTACMTKIYWASAFTYSKIIVLPHWEWNNKNASTNTNATRTEISTTMASILLNSTHITTGKLLPMVEATTKAAAAAMPITKTTTTIMTNLSVGSHGQNKRPTIVIYPTGTFIIYLLLSASALYYASTPTMHSHIFTLPMSIFYAGLFDQNYSSDNIALFLIKQWYIVFGVNAK